MEHVGGHIDIVKMMIDKGANDWNWGLRGACRSGHIEIIKLMIDKGANNWNLITRAR
jgi:ankyrin repeat protein